jgi:hypothetical protein
MVDDNVRRRQELRRSNAAAPHRNRHRERKTGQQHDTTVCYCGDSQCDECMSWIEGER